MSQTNESGPDDPLQQLRQRISELEAQLATAKKAAALAETEQGRLQGELTKTTDLWVAASSDRERWDVLLSENVEALRLANEQLEAARRARADIEQSTSWRTIQAALAPYRWARSHR